MQIGTQPTSSTDYNGALIAPSAFSYRAKLPVNFWRGLDGRLRNDFRRETVMPTPDVMPYSTVNTYYVDINRADDTGAGTSWATAKKSINAAITTANTAAVPYVILVRSGLYPRTSGFNGVVPTQPCSIMAVGGKVTTGSFDQVAWSLTSGTTYQATRSNVQTVVDLVNLDAATQPFAEPTLLTLAASLVACQATPGTWYTDGTTTYVNRIDGAAVTTANTRVYLRTSDVVKMSTAGNMMVSGFRLEGGDAGNVQLANAPTYSFYGEDLECGFAGNAAGTQNAFAVLDVRLAILNRCRGFKAQKDIFNSHINAGNQALMWCNECVGHNSGTNGNSNNGFTGHDGGMAIDTGGLYYGNYGGQVAFVNDNTKAWCVGTRAYGSLGDTPFGGPTGPTDFLTDQGTTQMWLDGCVSESLTGLMATTGTIAIRDGRHLTQRTGNVVLY